MKPQTSSPSDKDSTAKAYLTSYEAAQVLGVTLRTVQLWSNTGLLKGWKTEGGHRRIDRESVDRLLIGRGADKSPSPTEPHTEPATGAPRILVVEDDPSLLRLYRLQLARWPEAPEVLTAPNGVAGLVTLGRMAPRLLITDLHMPEMDGFQMLHILRAMPQMDATEIVVVSGLDAEEIAQRGGLPEGIRMLPKPVPFPTLHNIFTDLLARDRAGTLPERNLP